MPKKENSKLRVISLGGLGEIGKNLTVIEYANDIIIIDCGLGFPDEDMLGIDLVIPDVTYLEENRDRIRGLFLTHGHEDHIGAIPYVLRQINPPIYGTRLTLGILKNKLAEHALPSKPDLRCVEAGDTVKLGTFSIEFIHVNHSIADACALAIGTPVGTVIHSGDLKIDVTPIDGEMIDLTRFGELGKRGVLLFMCESTNAERQGHSPSEKSVGRSLEYIFTLNSNKRIIIATFSSNVHRVQQIIDASVRHSRKVAITGRSMLNIVGAAVELGYMKVPDGVLIDVNELRRYKPEEVTVITTGSQGEPMSALYRMATGDHSQVTLGANDLVVLSSSPIPGNEKLIGRIINELIKNGANVVVSSDDIVLYYDFLHHDVINYRGLKSSRSHSELDLKRLSRYGVSADMCYVAEQSAVAPEAQPVQKPSVKEQPKAVPKSESAPVEEAPIRVEKTDNSAEILATLDAVTQRVFSLMPIDRAVAPDEFVSSGVGISEAITALTMLELSGLCESLPGGTYIRK